MSSLRIRVGAICPGNDTILLVEHEKDGRRYWLLPGGGMEVGETAEDGLEREVLEETSMRVRVDRLLAICESVAPDKSRHVVHLLYATEHVSGTPGSSRDPRVRDSRFIPVENITGLTIHPPINAWLRKGLLEGFAETPEYLGSLWV